MSNTGTYDIGTLLAARSQSAKDFGFQTVVEILQADLAAWNGLMMGLIIELCEVTTDAQGITGASSVGEMMEVDEYGLSPTQKTVPGGTVAFPLKLFQYGIGWTRKFLETATPADLAQRQLDAEIAHKKAVYAQIQQAIFRRTNYTIRDFLVDNVDLAVKRFVNADSMPIPDGPNGETFDAATHDHFWAESSEDVDDFLVLIDDVVEHGHGGAVRLNINRASEATVSGYTGFSPAIDLNVRTPGGLTTYVAVQGLDQSRLDDRFIGRLGAADVYVRPWVPANYVFCCDVADPRKPLAFRQRSAATLQGLRIAAEFETYPLNAQYLEAEFGVGVKTRTNGALLYIASDTWADGV